MKKTVTKLYVPNILVLRIHLVGGWTKFEPTPLKNISQNGNLPQIVVNICIFETTTEIHKV